MYSHPWLQHPETRRHYALREDGQQRGAELITPHVAEPGRRTLDEKLDDALMHTFPASDAFFIG